MDRTAEIYRLRTLAAWLRCAATDAHDRYLTDEAREMNLRAWKVQDQIEALLCGEGR